jgi:hypothetical protein
MKMRKAQAWLRELREPVRCAQLSLCEQLGCALRAVRPGHVLGRPPVVVTDRQVRPRLEEVAEGIRALNRCSGMHRGVTKVALPLWVRPGLQEDRHGLRTAVTASSVQRRGAVRIWHIYAGTGFDEVRNRVHRTIGTGVV